MILKKLAYIFSNPLSFFRGESRSYPKRLLPKKKSKIISRNEIDDTLFLCRAVDSIDDLKDDNNQLSPRAIDGKEFFRLSTNIIFPPSVVADIMLRVTSEQYKRLYYSEGMKIPKSREIEFKTLDCGWFFFKISDAQNYSQIIPFNKNKKLDEDKKTIVTLFIDHKPMIFNYYHYESSVLFGDEEVRANDIKEGTYRAKIVHVMRSRFKQIAKFDLP